MVVLAMGSHVAEDYDLGYSWLETAHQQLQEHPITLDGLEEGDTLAMWDRNNWDQPWPGREVLVHMAADQHILLFDAAGVRIDEPESFVPNGLQPIRGDNGFASEWDGQDAYYCIPTVALGLTPVAPGTAPPIPPPVAPAIVGVEAQEVEEMAPPPPAADEPVGAEAGADLQPPLPAINPHLLPFTTQDGRVKVSFGEGENAKWYQPTYSNSGTFIQPPSHSFRILTFPNPC